MLIDFNLISLSESLCVVICAFNVTFAVRGHIASIQWPYDCFLCCYT